MGNEHQFTPDRISCSITVNSYNGSTWTEYNIFFNEEDYMDIADIYDESS